MARASPGERRRAVAGVLALAFALAAAGAARGQMLESFATDSLTVVTGDGERHRFRVELALTAEQRAQGLMFRRQLARDAGMLFVYRPARPVSMWMKNTPIPLDMLFIDREGRVVKVAERAVPGSLQSIDSGGPVKGVLELPGGTAERLGIAPGARVLHASFGSQG